MKGLIKNITEQAKANTFFRQVLETGEHTQVVIMSILPKEEIGMEVHPENDQVLYLLDGKGKVVMDGEEADYEEGDIALVRAGTNHNFINAGETDMKIITMYSPAHHPQGTIHKTKKEAEAGEDHY